MRKAKTTGPIFTPSAQSCVRAIGDSSARRHRSRRLPCFPPYPNSTMARRKAGLRASLLLATTVCHNLSICHWKCLNQYTYAGSTASLNPNHEMPPSLPPRQSPGPVAHRSPQASQGWHSPAPSAPTASQLAHMHYMSNSWALKPDSTDNPINPTWDSGPPDTSTWGVSSRQKHSPVTEPLSKPPLPVCIYLWWEAKCLRPR